MAGICRAVGGVGLIEGREEILTVDCGTSLAHLNSCSYYFEELRIAINP